MTKQQGFRGAVSGFQKTVIVAIVALMGLSAVSLQVLRVNGPLYQRVVLGKDLVADILPPPEYVLEAYLEATLARTETGDVVARRAARLKELRAQYDDRQTYWTASNLDPKLKGQILGPVNDTAARFWGEVEGKYLPALQSGDQAAAQASYATLSAAYAGHRNAVDHLVTDANEAVAASEKQARWISLAVLLVMAMGLVGAVLYTRRRGAAVVHQVVDPLAAMTDAMSRISEGDLRVPIQHDERTDELGAMARALKKFVQQGLETQGLREQQETARLHAEDLRVAGDAKRADALRGMAERVEDETRLAVQSVSANSEVMTEKAQELARLAADVGRRSGQVSVAAADTLIQTQTVAATATELDAAIQSIRKQVESARLAASQVAGAALDADGAIGRLSSAVGEIDAVTTVIDDIARQINLLALNASVEAARAGDAGRGFAVVAHEVRALAQQTAAATANIRGLIGGVKSSTEETVDAVRGITGRVGAMDDASLSIAGAVEQQASATVEIARSVTETNAMAERMVAQINQVADGARTAGEISDQVDQLSRTVSESVASLSTTLVRVVRTSTDEVERRRKPRFSADLPVQVVSARDSAEGVIRNLSEGGAMIDGLPSMSGRISLHLQGFSVALPADVLGLKNGLTHVKFRPDSHQTQAITEFFAGHKMSTAA